MTKQDLLLIIKNAKTAHQRWLDNAIALVEGRPLDKTQVPVNATDCEFGCWYYGEGQLLKPISVFRELGIYHDVLHHTYRDIFNLLFEEQHTKPSLINHLFGSSSSKENQQKARERLKALEQNSKLVIKKLDELESFVLVMAEEQIESFLHKH